MSEPGVDRREATVSDVARAAQVSKATAARALGDYGAVSDAVRDRVQKAAAELGYRPNAVARTMSTGRSHTLGIIVGDIENPFFARVTRGAADVAAEAGYDLILSNTDEDMPTEGKAIAVQLAKQVDGLLIAPASSLAPENLQPVIDAGRPLVLFDRTVSGIEADAVITDNRWGARQLTELLLRAGHRRIAFISTLSHGREFRAGDALSSSAVGDRIRGFVETLAAAGIPRPESYVHLDARRDGVDVLAARLIDGEYPVTAIIASDSLIALGAFRAAQARGLSIPDQLSLVGFDDADWMSLTTPGITVVEQPIHEIGVQATRLLLRRIHSARRPAVTTVLEQRLVMRDSVATALVPR
ncbi:LacI family DNA-binding transcriptional regulator [Microbacterium sp. NPDC058345]|uniref:LacI family DNA-binding transcriptional regulator n=1 Tax=Microbacterium sp. NPDC058345 TaxID=3346455 RepID=UPI0036644D48